MQPGIFLISLDFELYWGVRDHRTLEEYGPNVLGVRQVVPALLDLFQAYGIHATWATVGFLFFENKQDLIAGCPQYRPEYHNLRLSPYGHISTIGVSELEDHYHFGKSLIEKIALSPGQEIATHTFSHYYCREPGQNETAFRDDLQAAVTAARKMGVTLRSLVFPRNQANPAYLKACADAGITSYRGTERARYYAHGSREGESLVDRGMRLADSYVNLSGHNTYKLVRVGNQAPINLAASRFLRPYSRRLAKGDALRLRRICSGMEHAARQGEIFHLWWHPHNFGTNLSMNMAFLREVMDHFSHLHSRYGMESLSMAETAARRLANG